MENNKRATAKGVSFLGLLVLLLTGIFLTLKLTGYIAWSWWLVFLPLIIYVGGGIIITLAILGILAIITVIGLAIVGLGEIKK